MLRLLLLASLFLIAGSPAAVAAPGTIRLGAIVSLTGDAAKNGQNWLEGARLAVEDLNREGLRCELLIEDDQTRPVKVTSAFTKLATVDKVQGIVGGTWDFLAEAAYPLARRYAIPFVTPTNPVEVLSPSALDNPFIFTNGLSLGAERDAIKKFLQARAVRSLGLVYINVPYGTLHAGLLKALAQEGGAAVVVDQTITYEGFHDLIRQSASQIQRSKPELVFAVLNYEGIDLLLRELERLKSAPLVLMTHTLKEAYDYAQAPQRYQRSFGILQRYVEPDFEERFLKKFSHQPYGYAGPGYDAVQFLARSLARGIIPGASQASFQYPGVTGPHLYPARGRELVKTTAVVMRVAEGRLLEVP